MRSLGEHLDTIREKPHHVRRQVALGTAGALTAVIGLTWLSLSLYTGVFALKPANFAEVTGAEPQGDAGAADRDNAGVAGAASAEAASVNSPASGLEVVPADSGSAVAPQADPSTPPDPGNPASDSSQTSQTVIPF